MITVLLRITDTPHGTAVYYETTPDKPTVNEAAACEHIIKGTKAALGEFGDVRTVQAESEKVNPINSAN